MVLISAAVRLTEGVATGLRGRGARPVKTELSQGLGHLAGRRRAWVIALLISALGLAGCGPGQTYPGFSEGQLEDACAWVYDHGEVATVAACLTAAQANGYRTRYHLSELKRACAGLIAVQDRLNTEKNPGLAPFDLRIIDELAHGGPGVIYYRAPPVGTFLPRSCARVLRSALVQGG